MQNKRKGQVEALITMLLFIVVGLGMVYTMTQTLTNTQTALHTITNETLNLGAGSVNGTTSTLANHPLWSGTTATIIAGGAGVPVSGTNYTIDYPTGVITWASAAASGNVTKTSAKWNVTYVWTNETDTTNRTLLSILTTIVIAVIVVALVFKIKV